MKRYGACGFLIVALAFLLATAAWAADQPAASEEIPAILASLDTGKITILDDQASMAVRGQEYKYVLVRTVLNLFDIGPGLNWTFNPLGFRYGAWGGLDWSTGDDPADPMDALFMQHDHDINNAALIAGLEDLPNVSVFFWGSVYVPKATDIAADSGLPVTKNVWVSSTSILGGGLYFGWRPMPFTEYARREALTGMLLYSLIP